MDELIDSYENDGYVYCIKTGLNDNLVKIGKISMKQNDTEQNVIDRLVRRYNTYYPDCEIIEFMRTGNCHMAELNIFDLLKHLHYKREMYNYNYEDINEAFNKSVKKYPTIQDRLKRFDVKVLSELNRKIREKLKN